ncbi:hypothetical protein N7537_008675 [Penicillium hordei]|uniref:Uncharacterized protein n=1 Tax=Penicillium hordei TaxID=40994 RepID=A0AAD6E203_9EURO|nr:uncharacterized protein N7537_008675 [Penicillium hordei]KAJ5598591.1 hypothetical protein N7537_008675 [Penicillium hordei]
MIDSYKSDHIPISDTQDTSEAHLLYLPTAALLGSIPFDDDPSSASQLRPSTIPILQESGWQSEKAYDEDPPNYIHYFIEWRLILNKTAECLGAYS